MNDPVGRLEHAHGQLNSLFFDVSAALGRVDDPPSGGWEMLSAALARFRDALVAHFADEEEALFPFIRAAVPAMAATVDLLAAAHDTLCKGVVAMVCLAKEARDLGELAGAHERFGEAYVRHASDERRLFDELGRTLQTRERAELARRLGAL